MSGPLRVPGSTQWYPVKTGKKAKHVASGKRPFVNPNKGPRRDRQGKKAIKAAQRLAKEKAAKP